MSVVAAISPASGFSVLYFRAFSLQELAIKGPERQQARHSETYAVIMEQLWNYIHTIRIEA
jgi:hypothetical protein